MNKPQSIRVLIVDDNILVLETIERVLSRLHYPIVGRAMNGIQAVEMVQSLKPDIVLMDVQMPKLDGVAAARQIQEIHPTPVVMLTAHNAPELIERSSDAGVMAYLLKPPNASSIGPVIPIALARFEELQTLKQLNIELEQALSQVKQLQGLLPICANCKKIRDERGIWQQLERYIDDHSEARFTHGICPDCVQALYPEFAPDD